MKRIQIFVFFTVVILRSLAGPHPGRLAEFKAAEECVCLGLALSRLVAPQRQGGDCRPSQQKRHFKSTLVRFTGC